MALNTIFCHQHKAIKYIKSIKKQHFIFRFHLVPLVLGELCLQGQNSKNKAKRGLLEEVHVARRAKAHQVGSPDATLNHAMSLIHGMVAKTPWHDDPRLVPTKGRDLLHMDQRPTCHHLQARNQLTTDAIVTPRCYAYI